MENFISGIKKLWVSFQENTGTGAALVGLFLYFFNRARNRYDALVKSRIEEHEKKIEAHERRMAEQMQFVEQEIAGLNTNIIFNNMQNLEMINEIKKMKTETEKLKKYYRRKQDD